MVYFHELYLFYLSHDVIRVWMTREYHIKGVLEKISALWVCWQTTRSSQSTTKKDFFDIGHTLTGGRLGNIVFSGFDRAKLTKKHELNKWENKSEEPAEKKNTQDAASEPFIEEFTCEIPSAIPHRHPTQPRTRSDCKRKQHKTKPRKADT